MHAASVGCSQAGRSGCTRLLNLAGLHKQMLCPSSRSHKSAVAQTYTLRVRHKIYNNKSLPERHWNAATILRAALNSGWSAICYLEHLAKQKRLQPKHLKGLIAHVAHKLAPSGWNKPLRLSSQDNRPKILWSNLKHGLICSSINA